ncbi:MAG: hypothetical protein K2Q09_04265, partial [Phycisphaerales bacterium]|nr:hypothetical protein [Phycisphaerales bacterium]
KSLIFWEKTGAGEGIRTLDPNLGKVGINCFWRYPCSCRSQFYVIRQTDVFLSFLTFTRIFERSEWGFSGVKIAPHFAPSENSPLDSPLEMMLCGLQCKREGIGHGGSEAPHRSARSICEI